MLGAHFSCQYQPYYPCILYDGSSSSCFGYQTFLLSSTGRIHFVVCMTEAVLHFGPAWKSRPLIILTGFDHSGSKYRTQTGLDVLVYKSAFVCQYIHKIIGLESSEP